MRDNSDLIGKLYKNGEDGVLRYRVTGIDREFPNVCETQNILTEHRGCILADFVRPFLVE